MRRRSRSQLDAMDQINVTPLLDLTFVLLIIFMISMPLMEYGADVTPPAMNSDQLPESHVCNVALDKDGLYRLQNEVIGAEELTAALRARLAADKDVIVLLSGDQSQSYGRVVELWRLIRTSGISRVRLVTQAE